MQIEELINKDWFNDLDNSSYWLRIYSTLPISHKNLPTYFQDAINKITVNSLPIKIEYLGISGLKLPYLNQSFAYSDPDKGCMQIKVDMVEYELPKSSYVFFISPFKIDGKFGDESNTLNILNQVESILTLHIGNNLLHSIVFDGERAITKTGKSVINGHAIPTLQKCDGPFLDKKFWADAEETFNAIENLGDLEKQSRIRLALRFFQKGKSSFNSDESFFLYWTAIMTLLETCTTMPINKALQNLYGLSKDEVENDLYWKWAFEKRNDLFKYGVTLNFHMQRERYFQVLFLDLLRKELGLTHKHYLKNYIDSEPQFPN